MTPELIEGLLDALEVIGAARDARCVVLTGSGEAFCAGFDITRIDSQGGGAAGAEARLVERLCATIRNLRLPVIAKVNGVASGTGCDLAVSCDVRLASEYARFAMPPAKLGILYDPGGMRRLVQTVGPANAKELLLSAQLVGVGRALEMGLVNRVCPAGELDSATEEIVGSIVRNAPLSLWASKLVVNVLADGAPLPEGTQALIDDASRRVWSSDDAREGPRAFRERRPPRFAGAY